MNVHVIYGIGNGERIKQCLNEGNKILAYEPYRENYERYGHLLPKDKNLVVMVAYQGDMVDFMLSMFMQEEPKEIYYEILDKYDEAYPVEIEEFAEWFDEAVQVYQINIDTTRNFSEAIEDNIRENSAAILLGKPLSSIAKRSGPAFIIAAGPSLDKNISGLKNAAGMIISTDTAINPLLASGVVPHLSVSIDAKKDARHFADKRSRRIPLVCRPSTNKEIIKIHKGRKYFVGDEVLSGGSVSTDAMHIAKLLGYDEIVFVGLDLAYTGEAAYAKNTLNYGKSIQNFDDTCVGIDGETIPTTVELNIYRKWIERFIKANPKIRFVNCTEGGAKIAGAENVKLSDYVAGVKDNG